MAMYTNCMWTNSDVDLSDGFYSGCTFSGCRVRIPAQMQVAGAVFEGCMFAFADGRPSFSQRREPPARVEISEFITSADQLIAAIVAPQNQRPT